MLSFRVQPQHHIKLGVAVCAHKFSTQEVEAGGSGVQGYVHLHSSQDMPGIYETLSGRGRREQETEEGKEGGRDGETEGLEVGLTARTGVCEGLHMLVQGNKVEGGRNICTRVPLVAVFSRMVLPFHLSLVPAAESQSQSKSLKVLP